MRRRVKAGRDACDKSTRELEFSRGLLENLRMNEWEVEVEKLEEEVRGAQGYERR